MPVARGPERPPDRVHCSPSTRAGRARRAGRDKRPDMRPLLPLFKATALAALLAASAAPAAGQPVCPDPPLYPPTRAFLEPPRPCPGQEVRIRFATCAPCWDIVAVTQGAEG